ncbi:hypothetical protein MBLNU457_1294t1 [Dothideomycetes sp. NU457]
MRTDPYCDHLRAPNVWVLTLSIVLVLGILISYLPQHAKIVSNGTSAGLSPWWVMLGTLSSIAGITNIIVLPTSQHDMRCCKEISATECGAGLLGIVQVGVQWTCFMIVMILFLAFFPRQSDGEQAIVHPEDMPMPKRRDAVIVGTTTLCALLFCGIGSIVFLVAMPSQLLGWANFLGIAASGLAVVQYFPQIWTTWKLQRMLSLSVTTMFIQVPGAFMFAFSLFLRVGWQGWSSWLVYCVTGVCQACLLVMAITFWARDRKREREGIAAGDPSYDRPTERDALLARSPRRAVNSSTLRTLNGTKRDPIGILYSATPPEESSVLSEAGSSPEESIHRQSIHRR